MYAKESEIQKELTAAKKRIIQLEARVARATIRSKIEHFFFKCWIGTSANRSINRYKEEILTTYETGKSGRLLKTAHRVANQHPRLALDVIASISSRFLRRSFFVYIASLFTLFAACAGFWLAKEANNLLENQNTKIDSQNAKIEIQTIQLKKQNEKIDTQNSLTEATRRSTLNFELTSILEIVQREKMNHTLNLQKHSDLLTFKLSELTKGRIIALSRSLKPYRYLEEDGTLSAEMLSPERAQLLLSLHYLKLPLPEEAVFKYANLRGAELADANLQYANLRRANLQYIDLYNANLQYTNLIEADLFEGYLMGGNFENANLHTANLKNAYLMGANLQNAVLSNASLRYANLQGADLKNVLFDGVDFHGTNIFNIKNAPENFREKALKQGAVEIDGLKEWTKYKNNHSPAVINNS